MSQPGDDKPVVVGVEPWLPWPLCAWPWWIRPVRAERLAILRIGLALVLLVDLWVTYRPHLFDFFAKGGLGSPELYAWYGRSPRWNWSLLRGFGDPLLSTMALIGWVLATLWLAVDFAARLSGSKDRMPSHSGWGAILAWNVSAIVLVLGIWSRSIPDRGESVLPWAIPLGMLGLALAFLVLELWRLWFREKYGASYARLWWHMGSLCLFALMSFGGKFLPFEEWADGNAHCLGHRLLLSWQDDPVLLEAAFWTWFGATVGLMLGLGTRLMAVVVWVMSISFAHVNPYIDNAGDVVRSIILFYLMLCPCSAAWSLDRCLRHWRSSDRRPLYVSPWVLRLLFVQMAFIYFMNGFYKILGSSWLSGESLYIVLGDVTLTRFAYEQMPLPYFLTVAMTWTVLVWELGFPLWVALPWTRVPALVFGALFHLGIFLSMELGGFGPYMLTLYLPLLPLQRSARRVFQNP